MVTMLCLLLGVSQTKWGHVVGAHRCHLLRINKERSGELKLDGTFGRLPSGLRKSVGWEKKTEKFKFVLYLLIPLICAMRSTLQANTNVTPDLLSSVAPSYCNAAGKTKPKVFDFAERYLLFLVLRVRPCSSKLYLLPVAFLSRPASSFLCPAALLPHIGQCFPAAFDVYLTFDVVAVSRSQGPN